MAELGGPPAGALLFTCNGRGSHMFSTPDHDAPALDRRAGAPAAGFFCAGEIGPVGDRNFVHGFTATMALLAARHGMMPAAMSRLTWEAHRNDEHDPPRPCAASSTCRTRLRSRTR